MGGSFVGSFTSIREHRVHVHRETSRESQSFCAQGGTWACAQRGGEQLAGRTREQSSELSCPLLGAPYGEQRSEGVQYSLTCCFQGHTREFVHLALQGFSSPPDGRVEAAGRKCKASRFPHWTGVGAQLSVMPRCPFLSAAALNFAFVKVYFV